MSDAAVALSEDDRTLSDAPMGLAEAAGTPFESSSVFDAGFATRQQVEELGATLARLLALAEERAVEGERQGAHKAESEPDLASQPDPLETLVGDWRNRFYFYDTTIDAPALVRRYAVTDLEPDPEHATNFLGVRIPTRVHPAILDGMRNSVEGIPIPANWHADLAEFAAALRAVDSAGETFRMLELGCGWGCWMNITGKAARNTGRDVRLVGIEGDTGHIGFARETLGVNGLDGERSRLVHGVAGAKDGQALFPHQGSGDNSWGLEPVFYPSPADIEKMRETHQLLDVHTLKSLSEGETFDLLHIDIQGGEFDFVESCIEDIDAHVRHMVVGTHSRLIEGRLMDLMLARGWVLEIDRPAIFSRNGNQDCILAIDGVQGWRNRAFDG